MVYIKTLKNKKYINFYKSANNGKTKKITIRKISPISSVKLQKKEADIFE